MYKAVIFDLDGTLLDTLEDLAISFNHVFEQFNKSPQITEDFKMLLGEGAVTLLKKNLPHLDDNEQKEALNIFEKHYATQYNKNTKIYDEINKVLTFFQARNYKMAVLSNKPNAFTKKCVLKFLGAWKFDAVYGVREGIERKPNSAGVEVILNELGVIADECLFVGDSMVDMQTAKNSNIDSIGVLWGFRKRDELVAHGAKYIVEKPNEIIKLISTMQLTDR